MEEKKILIVEDEFITAEDLKNHLEMLGYEVTAIANTSEKALGFVRENRPHLVLMDIQLKGEVDGIETASQIRDLGIPVIYLTAHADGKTIDRAKITEPFGYVLKPFEDKSIVSSIEMALYKHKMEEKLQHQKNWLNTVLNSIGDGVIVTDKSGRVTFLNPLAQELTGWPQEEALGKPLQDVFYLVKEQSRERIKTLKEKVENQKDFEFGENTNLINRHGKARTIHHSCAPLKDEGGNSLGVVLAFRDITEQKMLEMELQRAQKMESLGILAGGLAHDLNNLLTAIMGNLYAAKKESTPASRLNQLIVEAEESAHRVKEITRQFISFSQGGVQLTREASLDHFLPKMVDFLFSSSSAKTELLIPKDLWKVKIDLLQIQQVLHNIVLNALQAMNRDGRITISACNLTPQERDRPLPLADQPYVKISIADNGSGMSQEALSKIFDPYFTTKKDGTGLGLSISFAIISKHKGVLTVESQVGQGSIFYIYLPALRDMPNMIKESENS